MSNVPQQTCLTWDVTGGILPVVMDNTLRIRRAERRLSQRALAKRARIQHDRYWRIQNDYAEPTDTERAALARVLGLPDDELFPQLSSEVAS